MTQYEGIIIVDENGTKMEASKHSLVTRLRNSSKSPSLTLTVSLAVS
jgi:hypothetical protein